MCLEDFETTTVLSQFNVYNVKKLSK